MLPKSSLCKIVNKNLEKERGRENVPNVGMVQSRSRPLPAVPRGGNSLTGNIPNRQNSAQYIDMTNAVPESGENLEDYVDMNPSKVTETEPSFLGRSAPKIPEKPNLNISRDGYSQVSKPPLRELKQRHLPTVPQLPSVDRGDPSPGPTISVLETSNCSTSPLNENSGSTLLQRRKCPPLPKRPPVSSQDSIDIEDIYEVEPQIRPKLPAKVLLKNQDTPLPPIPNQTSFLTKMRLDEASSLYSSPHPPPPFPKPIIRSKPEDGINIRSDSLYSDVDFDSENLPPPPPEFLDELDNIATFKEEPDLPRPPQFNCVFEQDEIRNVRELPHDDTSSSDEDMLFNPNNYSCYRNTDRKGAKQLLQRMEHLKNNAFLIRPSTHDNYFLGMTIFQDNYYYNLGIHTDLDGRFYCESLNERETKKCCSFDSFIEHYKYNPLTVKKKDGRVIELYLKYPLPDHIF